MVPLELRSEKSEMKAKKKSVPRPNTIKVYDAGGDLQKRWFVEWDDWSGNKRKRSYRGINQYHTARERYEAIQRLIADITNPDPDADCWPLVMDMRNFVRTKGKTVSTKTRQGYESKLRTFEGWYTGQVMDGRQAQAYLDHLLESGTCGKSTRNHHRVFMRMAYGWMMKRGLAKSNPFDFTEKVRAVRTPARPFNSSQIAHLKRVMAQEDPDLWMFCQVIYYCFIRPGELRQMIVGDIMWDEWCFLLRAEVSKNGKEQYVIIPESLRGELTEAYYGKNPQMWLFGKEGLATDRQIGKNEMSDRHRMILQEYRYSGAHKLYSWKHTGAKKAAMAGVSIKDLQVQLRHHSLDQVDEYLRSLGVQDLSTLAARFPAL